MKKIVIMVMAAVMAVSCFKGGYTESGMLKINFEFVANYDTMFGPDSLYYLNVPGTRLVIDGFAFSDSVSEDGNEFLGGMMFSYLGKPESDVTELASNEFRVNCAAPKAFVDTYAVWYENPDDSKMPKSDIEFIYKDNGTCIMHSCYVNNTVAMAEAAKAGLQLGQEITFRAIGRKGGVETVAEIILAKKTEQKDSIMYSWSKMDLTPLGSIETIDFELDVPEGLDVPRSVCIDEIEASYSMEF